LICTFKGAIEIKGYYFYYYYLLSHEAIGFANDSEAVELVGHMTMRT